MKKLTFALLFVLTIAGVSAASAVDYFHTDWETARKAARKQDKPLYVHFTTDWCTWCRKIEDDVYRDKEGKAALKPFVPVSLDCTQRGKSGKELKQARENIELMKQWGGGGYPFLVQVTADGTVFNSWSGYQPLPQFKQELKGALGALKDFRAFEEKAKSADRDSYEFNLQAMKVYSGVQKHGQALKAAKRVLQLDPDNKQGNAARAAMTRFESLQALGKQSQLQDALKQVQKYDPENKKGLWEKSASAYALTTLRNARSTSPDQRKKSFKRSIDVLQDLTEQDFELNQPQRNHYFLGILYAQAGQQNEAVKTLQEAVAIDPDSREAKFIKETISRLKKNR